MKRPFVLALSLLLASPAFAGVDEALDRHILPGFAAFAASAEALEQAAAADCRPAAVKPAFHAAFDAWMAVADLHIGPSETGALSVAFWPDTRGFTQRTLQHLIADEDPIAFDPEGYDEVSIAARGVFALEMLLFDPAFTGYGAGSYTCSLVQAIAADLAQQALALDSDWRGSFAATLGSAGAPGNTQFLEDGEALRALYTQLLSGLEFTADQRLGRPLGTFDRPRPTLAEAWRSGRSLRNVLLSVDAAQALAHALARGALPQTDAATARVHDVAERVGPAFEGVTDPQDRLQVEVLQQAVEALQTAIKTELGAPLGLSAGFNAMDGD
ncbi:imelysin family protein [Anianabacter salinae]|uniref:imelysin family protein n=1 Tax=Anianabacter salinae TaxID=2851023 RepID=UPI00225E4E72|nr:imelysin family protein [Anianabacter salinae]MBV0911166.1 imelysin family protein [Anianabacter salinae]